MDNTITLIISVVSAITAVVALLVSGYLTQKTIGAYHEQIQIGQNQVKVMQEQVASQFKPVLYPSDYLGDVVQRDNGILCMRLGLSNQEIGMFQNMGVGPAFCIYGTFFGKAFNTGSLEDRYCIWNHAPILPGPAVGKMALELGTNLPGNTLLGKHTLHVPDDKEHQSVIGRLSITYRDVFGRKYASIYDYTQMGK